MVWLGLGKKTSWLEVKITFVMLRTSHNLRYLCDVNSKHYVFIYGQELTTISINFRFHTGHELPSPGSRSVACLTHNTSCCCRDKMKTVWAQPPNISHTFFSFTHLGWRSTTLILGAEWRSISQWKLLFAYHQWVFHILYTMDMLQIEERIKLCHGCPDQLFWALVPIPWLNVYTL